MLKNLPLFIGLRYTRSKRKEGYISFVSGFSLGAMALGVMSLIVVLSVMNGFDREIKSRLLRVAPHVTLTRPAGFTPEEVNTFAKGVSVQSGDVKAITPITESFVMLSNQSQRNGISLQGIDPMWSDIQEQLADYMLAGYLEKLQPGQFGVVLGSQVARRLAVFVGDTVTLTLPQVSVTPAGIFPRVKTVTVVGIFQVGAQVDANTALMHQGDVRKLLRLGEKSQGMRIQLSDPYQAEQFILDNNQDTNGHTWHSWITEMGTLFQAMKMEKVVVGLLLSVIIAVAAFNIIASLVLMVSGKRKDIAVVRTLGASSGMVMRIFVVQGMAVGIAGILIGTILGCLLAYFVGDIVTFLEQLTGRYMFDPSVYLISALPSRLLFSDVMLVVSGALLVSFLATLYPAWRAGQVLPAEALRYDH